MLKQLRENFKHLKWILWAVIAIFVLFVFVDWGMGYFARRGGTDTTLAAKAGGIRVTTAEFQKEYAFAEERYRQAYGKNFSPELARAMNLPEQVLNGMIDRRLLRARGRTPRHPGHGRGAHAAPPRHQGPAVGPAAVREGRRLRGRRRVQADPRREPPLARELRGRFARRARPREAEPLLHAVDGRRRRRREVRVREPERQGEDRVGARAAVHRRAGRRVRDGGGGLVQDESHAVHAAREAQGEVPPRRDGEDSGPRSRCRTPTCRPTTRRTPSRFARARKSTPGTSSTRWRGRTTRPRRRGPTPPCGS